MLVPFKVVQQKKSRLGSGGYTQEMNKSDVLVSDYFHLIDEAKSTKLIAKLLFCHAFIQTSNVDVPAGIALTDRQRYLSRYRGWFTPADLQFLAVQRKFLDGS